MKHWDIGEWIATSLVLLVMVLVSCVAVSSSQVINTCERTTDSRLTTVWLMVGGVMMPTPVTQTRYVCPNGKEAWL